MPIKAKQTNKQWGIGAAFSEVLYEVKQNENEKKKQ